MMWNTNSDQIADLVLKWIEKHIEKKESEDALVNGLVERCFGIGVRSMREETIHHDETIVIDFFSCDDCTT